MSKTVAQIFAINPVTTILNNDLFYLVNSPYTPGTDAAISGISLKALFLQPSNNLSDLSNTTTARTNLGLTALATAMPPLSGTLGGTGVNNGASLITIGGNLTFSGAFSFTGTLSSTTNITFPTSGTLATTSQLPTPSALTSSNDTNVTVTLGGTPATSLLQTVSLTMGWTGTLSGTRGGTGVNNGTNTATYAGNLNFAGSFTTSGAFSVTQTYTGATNVTFPTSGTLATTSQIPSTPISLANGGTGQSLVSVNNAVFSTTSLGVSQLSTTLPSGISATNMNLTTPTLGVATATSIAFSPTTGGIIGTTASDNAGSGFVGEYKSTVVVSGSAVNLSSNAAVNIATLSLTAGDWDVWGELWPSGPSGTSYTDIAAIISTSSATNVTNPGDNVSYNQSYLAAPLVVGTNVLPVMPIAPCRINISSTTNVFLECFSIFTVHTATAYGKICARRRR